MHPFFTPWKHQKTVRLEQIGNEWVYDLIGLMGSSISNIAAAKVGAEWFRDSQGHVVLDKTKLTTNVLLHNYYSLWEVLLSDKLYIMFRSSCNDDEPFLLLLRKYFMNIKSEKDKVTSKLEFCQCISFYQWLECSYWQRIL